MPSTSPKAPPLLSIKDIASLTGLEESLLRYYESEYPSLLPAKILKGNQLFFTMDAVESFRDVHMQHGDVISPQVGPGTRYGRVIAVTSGKGGVGKTSLALNLAIELQRQGKMCILFDADMGMANVHLMVGLHPGATLLNLLRGEARVADLVVEGPEGIGIIAGGNGMAALADAPFHSRQRLITALSEIEGNADFFIVDTGAGMNRGVRDFLMAADDIIFTLTPEITSLADGYGLLKTVAKEKKELRSVFSVINMVENLQQAADAAARFSACSKNFLGVDVFNIGYILKDATVAAAIARRTPCCVFRPHSRASRNIRHIATVILQREQPEIRLSSAFKRYMSLLQAKSEKQ